MGNWTSAELTKIGNAEELMIATKRSDGTLRKQVIIWAVRLGDDLYVRSVNGRSSWWFKGVQTRHEGNILAGGVVRDVCLEEVTDLNDEIDAAYRKKYNRYAASIISHITSSEARSATLKLMPVL
jgi:hypothetical protein